ncbi:MAG: hypothetical protein NZ811_02700, partial [Gammaproteobacteria bacterium]|nr:hypothetical protein [Gammaproteobacteria bacterium]
MKNRIIYWGGNENTIIPRMGACGEGVDAEPGGGPGGGSGGGPESPAATASAPDTPSLFDKLKGLLPALALGALALAAVAGAVIMLRKNRDGDPTASWDNSLPDAENFANLGLDIEGATTVDLSANLLPNGNPRTGFNEDGLPIPPDFVGQQIIDEDGNLWEYKDPPGAWINFGNEDFEAQYTTDGETQVPIYEDYFGNITDVVNDKEIVVDTSWATAGEAVGQVAGMDYSFAGDNSWRIIYPDMEKDLYTYLLFDEDKSSLIVNFQGDTESYTEYPHSVVYKLYEPLPEGIEGGDLTFVVREMTSPYTETVQLVDFVEEDIDAVVLRNPKWDSENQADSYYVERDTKFKSYDDLVSSDTSIKEAIENEIISGSFLESIELTGVDYSDWDNFIHFSSVEDRVKNFKRKLQKIELYTSQSNSLLGISGSLTYAQTASLEMKVKKLKNEFVPFESYMHFQ